jgi:SpoIID/LytB domain protein
MTVIDLKTGKEAILPDGVRLSCALGNFDGVHLGHSALLTEAAKKEYDVDASAVWTFRVHPQIYLGNPNVRILTSMEQKLEYFKELGIDYAILEDFPAVSSLSPEEFAKVLDLDVTDYDDPNSWLGDMTYTTGNGVNTMVICGRTFKGTELRKLLDLRSTSFTINADADKLIIVTRGYGHRVGMSQYGADAMAVQGNTFEQILAHYYQGTDLTKWGD